MKKKPLSYYLDLIKSAQDKQNWNKAKRHGEIALKKLPVLFYSPLEKYHLYGRLGFAYYHLSQPSRSLDMWYTANLIASKYHLAIEQVIFSVYMVGLSFSNMARVDQAILQLQKVEQYYQKYGDGKLPMDKEKHFLTLVVLGTCYLDKNELEKAKSIITEKIPPYQNQVNNFAEYYHLEGEYLMQQKEYGRAKQVFQKYVKMNELSNALKGVFEGNFKLAVIDLLEGNLESAVTTLEGIIKDARKLKFNLYVCASGLLLSKCYLLKKLPAKSAAIEKMITPLLSSLDITWFYEQSRESEQLYHQLQSVYQNAGLPVIPELITDTIQKHYKTIKAPYVIIGKSALIIEIYKLIEKIAPTDLPIVIQGETGTGKELVARAIHSNSQRKEKMWLAANCGVLSETLLENELFGHDKGAFTDAQGDKKGYIELASEGTLFLDEISEMSPAMQQKLLRVLEEKQVWRVGAEKAASVNTRFVFASNQNIEELVKAKKIREDLYYRINTIVITLPPLKDRKEDIPFLVDYFLNKYSHSSSIVLRLSPDTLRLFVDYHWPGNIRELENEIKKICALYSDSKEVNAEMISETIRNYKTYSGVTTGSLEELRNLAEKNIIMNAINKCRGNITEAACLLKYDRANLYKKIRRFNISIPNKINTPLK